MKENIVYNNRVAKVGVLFTTNIFEYREGTVFHIEFSDATPYYHHSPKYYSQF